MVSDATTPSRSSTPAIAAEIRFDVPPFPTTATQLVSELNNLDVQVSRIIQLIECEPMVAGKVLHLANSPLYGATRTITTIGHAIVILGFKSWRKLALTIATSSLFDRGDAACSGQRHTTFCQSLAVATVARLIAKENKLANPDESFLAGVMHDIGKLMLLESAETQYLEILEQDRTGDTTAIETSTFAVSHPELGAACGQHWGLPCEINHAIQDHHLSICDVANPLSTTIIAANHFAREWQIGFESNALSSVDDAAQQSVLYETVGTDIQSQCLDQYAALHEICLS